MPLTADIEIAPKISSHTKKDLQQVCDHCGEPCVDITREDGHVFCCEGCKQVFQILHQTEACNPSMMEGLKGISPKGKFNSDKWNYLDEPEIASKLVGFSNSKQVHILLKLPNIHCSSCIWLLEHLNRINPAVLSSAVDFNKKEAALVFDPSRIKLSSLAALLEYIGYPPLISYADNETKRTKKSNRDTLLRIGIAGFCFSNIMMLSFPDYLASEGVDEKLLSNTFNYISLMLSLPVLLYAAAPFFIQGWKGLRQRFLNIDAPIALAILITFASSVYEILSATGTGYLDSMSGIVFFMLIGRWFQEKTQDAVSFERDYRSFFPMSALVLGDEHKQYKPIENINVYDRIMVRNQELIPADAVLTKGLALIDYSFVTGEKDPVPVEKGEIIFAGGKQMGAAIELRVIRTVSTSHLTRLWNNEAFQHKNKESSFVHPWARYFSTVLFAIAITSAMAPSWNASTARLVLTPVMRS